MSTKSWYRSLAELEDSPEFIELMHREFPQAASEFPTGVSRRRWLQLMGASLVLGGVTGCRFEEETLAPFATRPANRIPGKPKQFNTTFEVAGVPQALRVTSYDGRPIKVDGNPDHPSSGGASSSYAQGTVLDLYDPDRLRAPLQRQNREVLTRTWQDVETFFADAVRRWTADEGVGLAILAEPSSSPTVARLRSELLARFPKARWFEHSSIESNTLAGTEVAFGTPYQTHLDLTPASVVLALDCDLFGTHPDALRLTRQYAARRTPDAQPMLRLYAVECELTPTGAAADHRLAIPSSQIGAFLAQLESALSADPIAAPADTVAYPARFLAALADDLRQHAGSSLLVVGPNQPPAVQALAHRINATLKNTGTTVWYTRQTRTPGIGSLSELTDHVRAGQCQTLVILGGNPVYSAPVDLSFTETLNALPERIHLTLSANETSAFCTWILPQSHPLECWSDCQMTDGTCGLGQPLIAPLFDSRSVIEVVGRLAGRDEDGLAAVRRTAAATFPRLTADREWTRVVHDGFIAPPPSPRLSPEVRSFESPSPADWKSEAEVRNGELELIFSHQSSVYDGRYANNGWLQELPQPLTKLTWGNAAVMSPKTAATLNVKDHDVVALELDGRRIEIPVYVLPGQATGTVAVALGYGRTRAGLIGGQVDAGIAPVGVQAELLRTSSTRWGARGLNVVPTGRVEKLAATQDHYSIDKIGLEGIHGRIGDLVREADLSEYLQHPDFARHKVHHPPLESPWTEHTYDGHAWGMAIDLNRCIGCNACTIACQAENNVPIVGAEQVLQNREMHWLRVDRYFAGDPEQPQVITQPVTCHHCENAPCEQVCPVAATVHSDEGLNDMAYNRCIGTRYCGNNCPYKVRRFNFLDYRGELPGTANELTHLVLNPEVTVRSRGVMEKCTYCVQRIQNTRIDARNDGRSIGANEIQTACQQVCAARAIVFGDLNNPDSAVARAHADPRSYAMLGELNVKPRTRYLARIRNPHPWLSDTADPTGHEHTAPKHAGNSLHLPARQEDAV